MRKKSLIVWEKNPLSDPNDFIHHFLLIFNKLSCLLTSEIATPPPPTPTLNQSIFLRERLGSFAKVNMHLKPDKSSIKLNKCRGEPKNEMRVTGICNLQEFEKIWGEDSASLREAT